MALTGLQRLLALVLGIILAWVEYNLAKYMWDVATCTLANLVLLDVLGIIVAAIGFILLGILTIILFLGAISGE